LFYRDQASSRVFTRAGPIGDIGQEIYLREEQKPEALAGQTAISGIDRHDIIQMAIEPT
jgi:hypothetical protein